MAKKAKASKKSASLRSKKKIKKSTTKARVLKKTPKKTANKATRKKRRFQNNPAPGPGDPFKLNEKKGGEKPAVVEASVAMEYENDPFPGGDPFKH